MTYQDVLHFWFDEATPAQWFEKDPTFDETIRQRFGECHRQATQGELVDWRVSVRGRLAEIIVLDQFSRNLYRDDARSFAYDGMALVLTQEAMAHEDLSELTTAERAFLYMPLMHSESEKIHQIALKAFSEPGLETNLAYEKQHYDIIKRFGRYPHRNAVLGRPSTSEEIAFLKMPGSSF